MSQDINSDTPKKPENKLNIKQAAIYLGISTHTLRKLCYDRKIPFYKPFKSLEFRASDLDAWVESKRIEPNPVQPNM